MLLTSRVQVKTVCWRGGKAYSVQRERRNDRSVEVRNLNVGTMTGKGRVLAGYIVQRMLIMDLPGGEKGRTQGQFVDVVKEDMQRVGLTKEKARNTERWKQIICSKGSS